MAALLCSSPGLAASCGGQAGSAAAIDTKGVALHPQYQRDANSADSGDPLPTIVDIIRIPQQSSSLMSQMAAVAPMPIENDFNTLTQSFQTIAKNEPGDVTNPLKSLSGSVIQSIQVAGPFGRVNSYISSNCSVASNTSAT
jgi:hypothetical protein